jgi:sugar phosphate isomerase/epimerase
MFLGGMGLLGPAAGTETTPPTNTADASPKPGRFRWCFNTGTVRGLRLPLAELVEIAAAAGYEGIEPWIDELRRHVEQGGKLAELRKRIAETGLVVESAIGFPPWCVDDDAERAKGLEQMKREMALAAELGSGRIAAPPAGAHDTAGLDLRRLGERYRAVLELGRRMGVMPQLEIWGSSRTLGRLSEAAFVAIEAAHPDAALLLDVYHIYRGGSDFAALRLLNGSAMHVFHMNDYPAEPPREKLTDAHRVYPGDGIAPLGEILRNLWASGFRGALSLELFNREYLKRPALEVARAGLDKMKAVVAKAMSVVDSAANSPVKCQIGTSQR